MVYALLEKEKELKLKNEEYTAGDIPNNDQQASYSSVRDEYSEVQRGPPAVLHVNTSEKVDNVKKKRKVCYYYRQNRCKYGAKGRDCPYPHSNPCNKYTAFGIDPIKGCNKGEECQYFHPSICFGSERRRECLNIKCKQFHLKGTRCYPANEHRTIRASGQQAPPPRHHHYSDASNHGTSGGSGNESSPHSSGQFTN